MNNFEVIETINTQASRILERMGSREDTMFQINELEIENGIFLRGHEIKGSALKNILKMLGVRPEFLEYSNKMTSDDWHSVSEKIKGAIGSDVVYAKTVRDDDGWVSVIDIFKHNGDKKKIDNASFDQYIQWITEALGNSKNNYELKDFFWNAQAESMNINLLNKDTGIDVFGTDLDVWKMGQNFSFSAFNFDYAPFFERLVCSNGNVAKEFGFRSNISQGRFNNKKIQSTIEKNILQVSTDMPWMLQKATQHLKENNISIAEFQHYKNFFGGRNQEERYDNIMAKFFNETPFYKAYGVNLEEKSKKWKSTANTGINAYDFFNMLTWIASHPEEVKMDKTDRINLQIQSSNLLFKNQLDLEDVATNVVVEYPRLVSMN
jgi:hypothetical protein